ncbi:MAG: hypothetical protein ACXVHL_30055 [Solirubrobacteraceae bacterium]
MAESGCCSSTDVASTSQKLWLAGLVIALIVAGGALAAVMLGGSGGQPRTSVIVTTGSRTDEAGRSSTEASTPATSSSSTATTDTGTTPAGTPSSTQFSSTCRIKAWYTSYTSPDYGYIHFKCVDEATGTTVAEALGSDNFNFNEEQQAAKRTAKRVDLVNQLKRRLQGQGWKEIGPAQGGEWYQLRYGR